jgi:hypothetical protein
MGATAEQMTLIDASSMDHVSYILILLSVACIVFLFANVLISLYDRLSTADTGTINSYADAERAGARHIHGYELHGLMSDDENEDGERKSVSDSNGGGSNFTGSSSSTLGQDDLSRT